jgi:hypothetical protein
MLYSSTTILMQSAPCCMNVFFSPEMCILDGPILYGSVQSDTQWVRLLMGWTLNGLDTRWVRYSMGRILDGSDSRWVGYLMGRIVNGSDT